MRQYYDTFEIKVELKASRSTYSIGIVITSLIKINMIILQQSFYTGIICVKMHVLSMLCVVRAQLLR